MNKLRCLLGIALVSTGLPASPAWAADAAAGARKAVYCAYCHGSDGNPASVDVPRLAGQSADALIAKMKRQLPSQDRRHPMYQAFVTGNCLNAPEMANLAAYFSAQSVLP